MRGQAEAVGPAQCLEPADRFHYQVNKNQVSFTGIFVEGGQEIFTTGKLFDGIQNFALTDSSFEQF